MSEALDGAATDGDDRALTPVVEFDAGVGDRVARAAEVGDFESVDAFIHEATLRLVDETIDGDGRLECPHDECPETFATIRQRRGHLGAAHAQEIPDGDMWCGYCGYGPTTWRGVNAHHSQRHPEDGDPVRLDHEPDRDELLAPDDVPDHMDPDLLARLYREHDGNYTAMCRDHDFEVVPGRVRHYLIEFGIHEVNPQGPQQSQDGPLYRNPDWLEERYEAAGGNISEMHRRIQADEDAPDVPYRTLVKSLKTLEIHDPTDPPGKRHGKGGPKPSTSDQPDEESSPTSSAASPSTAPAGNKSSGSLEEPGTNDPGDDVDEPKGAALSAKADESNDDVDDSQDESGPDRVEVLFGVTDPESVESFQDLDTPGWLDEGSFHAAADMAADVDEFVEFLGWDDEERVAGLVELLDLDVEGGRIP